MIKGLFQKRGIYYYQPPMVDGRRPSQKSLRTSHRATAIKRALELEQHHGIYNSRDRLSAEIDRFIAAKTRGGEMRRRSLESSRNTLQLFCRWADDPETGAVTKDVIEAWRDSMVERGMSDSGMVAYLRRVQSFFGWLKDQERITVHPFDGVKIPKIKRAQRITFCSAEQRDQLLETCDREDVRFVLMCGFFLGLRIAEIVEAIPLWFRVTGMVELTNHKVGFSNPRDEFKLKDGELRTIHYNDRFRAFIEDYGLREPFMLRPDVARGKANRRWDPRRPYTEHCEAQGLRWVTPHVMRHTFATLHVQAGTPIATVARWLGDSVEVTYNHYAAYAPTPEHINNI
jgi:integrase